MGNKNLSYTYKLNLGNVFPSLCNWNDESWKCIGYAHCHSTFCNIHST